jgi:hypothetical protein
MAGNFVGGSTQSLGIVGITAVNNGTLLFLFKSSTTGTAMVPLSGDSGTTTNYNAVFIGGNFEGIYGDESIGWQCNVAGAAYLRMTVRNGTDFYQDGAWHRFAIRCDGSDNAIFADGVRQTVSFGTGSTSTSNAFIPYVTRAVIAKAAWGAGNNLTGVLGDMRVSTVGFSDSECIAITSPANFGNDGIVRGMQNHWRIDEKSAGQTIVTAQDLYNDQDGTGTNSPTYIGSPLRTLRSR